MLHLSCHTGPSCSVVILCERKIRFNCGRAVAGGGPESNRELK